MVLDKRPDPTNAPGVRELAARQADIVARWQLLAAGWSEFMVEHRVQEHGWRTVHPGVYALTHAPLTERQRWIAATLTSPHSFLSHWSGAACYGIRPFTGSRETITRPGSGGPRRMGGVVVYRSRTLKGNATRYDGIKITTAARVLIDLAPRLGERDTGRAFREALRLKVTTAGEVGAALVRHPNHRGTRFLRDLAERYGGIPYGRTRSNAEARALEVLHDAGIEPPLVNVRIAGEEADLVWRERRLIIEIDGPQYHRFADEDARKQRCWEGAGYTVRRIPSDLVYHEPGLLIAAAA